MNNGCMSMNLRGDEENDELDADPPFISPVISSRTVRVAVTIGGRIEQPPIDLDDIVYLHNEHELEG